MYSYEDRIKAVELYIKYDLCAREGSASAVADRLGTSRHSLYKWKKELLGEEDAKTMDGSVKPRFPMTGMHFCQRLSR